MAEKEKRTLFGMDSEDLADALEAIFKKQKATEQKLEEVTANLVQISAVLLQMRTRVITDEDGASKASDSGNPDDGVPAAVKWALQQPWGAQLMHGLTDQEMISGLVKTGLDWLKKKAVEKAAS